MYRGASLWVDAWQCARTYGVQRPGKTSGAYNRSLCRSAPVLSRFPGAGLPRIRVGRFFAVLLVLGGGLALFVPAAGAEGLPDRPAERPGVREKGARSADVDLLRNQGRSIGVVSRYRLGQDHCHREPGIWQR